MDPARPDPRLLPSPHGAPSPSPSAPRHSHPPRANAHPGLGAARSRPIRPRIAANNVWGTATPANWNVGGGRSTEPLVKANGIGVPFDWDDTLAYGPTVCQVLVVGFGSIVTSGYGTQRIGLRAGGTTPAGRR